MGLLTILKKVKQKEQEMRILILGLDNAGKTTVVKRLLRQDVHQISPTVGFSIESLVYHDNEVSQDYHLSLVDVGGQKSIRSFWRNYFEACDGIIWVVDACDVERIHECKEMLEGVLKQEKLAGASLLIFANKQDLGGALSYSEISQHLELENSDSMGDGRHWKISGCSAITGQGVDEGLSWIVKDIASRVFVMS